MENIALGEVAEWLAGLSEGDRARFDALRARHEPRIAVMKRFRTALGLSQLDVAEALSITQSGVSKIENHGDPSIAQLVKVAQAKDYEVELVLTKNEEKIRFAMT